MLLTKILQLIDEIFDSFKDWGYKTNCVKLPCSCTKNDPFTSFVRYKLYT